MPDLFHINSSHKRVPSKREEVKSDLRPKPSSNRRPCEVSDIALQFAGGGFCELFSRFKPWPRLQVHLNPKHFKIEKSKRGIDDHPGRYD